MSSAVLEHAVSQGVNYVFYSSDLHASSYNRCRSAIRRYCKRGSSRRDRIVLAAATYMSDAEKIGAAVADQLDALGVDHVDIFHWGWVTRASDAPALASAADRLLRTTEGRRYVDRIARVTRQVGDELRCRGYARFIGISTHDRRLAAELAAHPLVDVVMFRYNIAHRGAEHDIFPELGANRPGTVSFNACHDGMKPFMEKPAAIPPGKYVPTPGDLYRFALDRNEIDVVLSGPSTVEHVDRSLEALDRKPLDPVVRKYLCAYGDVVSGRAVVEPDLRG